MLCKSNNPHYTQNICVSTNITKCIVHWKKRTIIWFLPQPWVHSKWQIVIKFTSAMIGLLKWAFRKRSGYIGLPSVPDTTLSGGIFPLHNLILLNGLRLTVRLRRHFPINRLWQAFHCNQLIFQDVMLIFILSCHFLTKLFKSTSEFLSLNPGYTVKVASLTRRKHWWIWQMALLVKDSSRQFYTSRFQIICEVKNRQLSLISLENCQTFIPPK
jgi:hypothetical protein